MYLAKKAFGKGFSPISSIRRFQQRWYIAILKKDLLSVIHLCGGIIRLFIPYEPGKFSHKEKGFFYFQDFVPDKFFDFRIHIIGNYCWGFQRIVRKNDFRVSGNGMQKFDLAKVPLKMIQNSLDIAAKLNSQSADFVFVINSRKSTITA